MNYDELVKKLRSGCDTCKLWDGSKCCLDGDCTRQTILQAADAIEELQARVKENDDWWAMAKTLVDMVAPKWIPVTERLPLLMTPVLITDGIEVDIAWMFGVPARWAAQYTDMDADSITHWMDLPKTPLPEPPKEAENV